MERLTINTRRPREVVDITEEVQRMIRSSGLKNGVAFLFVIHTTAALTTADLDPGTDLDMLDAFEAIMPKLNYRHPHDPEHVTDHILSSLIGPSVAIFVKDGSAVLGTWQRIVLIETSGPRKRSILFAGFQEE
jgi:secondary thiamine-phosphate synthase enzyme